MRKGTRAAAMGAVAALAMGCGSGGHPRAQPAPGVTAFTGGAFDQIPLFPRSEPLGARNNTTTISQQSFQATGADAEQVVDWYRDHLNGWTVIQAPHGTGATDFAGEWEKGDRRLRVTAGPAPTLGPRSTIQFSLLVRPR